MSPSIIEDYEEATVAEPVTAPAIEPTTLIKPSEAIRLGRLTLPRFMRGGWRDKEAQAACTVGAMAEGLGIQYVLSGDMLGKLENHLRKFDSEVLTQFVGEIPGLIDSRRLSEDEVLDILIEAGY